MYAQAHPSHFAAPRQTLLASPAIAAFIGRVGLEERRRFDTACQRAGHRPLVVAAASAFRELLANGSLSPSCVFVDPELPGAPELISWIRGNPHWYGVSVVALVEHPTEGAYLKAHALGVDDVTLRSDVGTITRRLAAIGRGATGHAAPTQGLAWVAHPNEERRCLVGRVLRQAGFEVAFASSAEELSREIGSREDIALLTLAESLTTENPELVDDLREACGRADLPTVILDAESRTEHAGGTTGRLGVVADASAPDNLLFVVNELLARLEGDLRSSQRLLYSTLCAFRRPHDVSPEYGLTYNISRDGLYVRTVDPPAGGSCLWLELRPPGVATIVHLRARVVWVQTSADGARATVPSGFGVRILERDCPPTDLDRYRTAYQTFREEPRPYVVPTDTPATPSPRTAHTRPRVLVIDDDERTLRVYRRVLEGANEVITAASGVEAIRQFETVHFDAVMTDIGMPEMSGLEVLRRIHEHRATTPVVIATGAPSVDTAIDAIEHGAFRYLTKPFDAATLEATIERAVHFGRLAELQADALRLHEDAVGSTTSIGARESFGRALDQLYLAYQPIVAWDTQTVFGYETLVRSKEASLPHPGALFEAAEELHELPALGRSIRTLAATREGASIERLFVNLHPEDLLDPDLYDPAAPLSAMAHRVTLEITERHSLEGIANVTARIADLRKLGFTIAIDDLGAGFAGLTSFAQLEPEVAKLDMSLIRDVHRVPTKQRLVRSFQQVCDDLGVLLICEGVETVEERDCLVELGCNYFQGYLFGRPRPTVVPPTL